MDLIVAEKPSVARDIARVVGASKRGDGFLEGPSHVVTWCIGHLVELEEPAHYDARWKAWRLDTLPMIPERFALRPVDGSRKQWAAVKGLLRDRRFSRVVNACDAGREGELIFRHCYELANARLPIARLWVSSLTDVALRAALAKLAPGDRYDPLADAARCRSEADWLVGMNATRALTVRSRGAFGTQGPLLSVGRVQTPTLAMVVEREQAIRAFVPKDYWEVFGDFRAGAGAETFRGRWEHDRLSVFGIGADLDDATWRSVFRQLVAQGLVRVDHEAYGALKLAEASRAVLRGEATVAMRRSVARAPKVKKLRGEAASLDAGARTLFDALKAWRLEQAKVQGVPAYVILHDRTLAAIAQARPATLADLARIGGIGAAKLDRYGAAIVALAGERA